MKYTYDEALRRILIHEGGYTNDAADPGGPTNFGITIHDFQMYLNPKGTAADVKNLTVDQAKVIYKKHYADPLRYDDLPAGLDYCVLDYGVNSGISRSAKVLQRFVNTTPDGIIGPNTLAAVNRADPSTLINDMCNERLAFLQRLRTWSVFGRGWGRRVREVRAASLVLTHSHDPIPGKAIEETK